MLRKKKQQLPIQKNSYRFVRSWTSHNIIHSARISSQTISPMENNLYLNGILNAMNWAIVFLENVSRKSERRLKIPLPNTHLECYLSRYEYQFIVFILQKHKIYERTYENASTTRNAIYFWTSWVVHIIPKINGPFAPTKKPTFDCLDIFSFYEVVELSTLACPNVFE